jgi:GMP synthase-like glutamine amidotransferase
MKQIAIYHCNTDTSDFAARNETDAVKVTRRLKDAGADYDIHVFDVTEGRFPDDPTIYDAVILTGSPAFVDDPFGWVEKTLEDIRKMDAAGTPMIGLCFGHQAIMAALGGKVGRKDAWIFGGTEFQINQTRPWMTPGRTSMKLYAANIAQAIELPPGFDLLGGSDLCPIALTARGDRIFTTQFHPEMGDQFISDLVEEYADEIGDGIEESRASIKTPAEGPLFGQWMRDFIELPRD